MHCERNQNVFGFDWPISLTGCKLLREALLRKGSASWSSHSARESAFSAISVREPRRELNKLNKLNDQAQAHLLHELRTMII